MNTDWLMIGAAGVLAAAGSYFAASAKIPGRIRLFRKAMAVLTLGSSLTLACTLFGLAVDPRWLLGGMVSGVVSGLVAGLVRRQAG